MNASQQTFILLLLTALAMASLAILITAIKGDNMLRIALAGAGFLTFGGLLTALLIARSKGA